MAGRVANLVLLSMLCVYAIGSENRAYAPLPDPVLRAKTAYLVNDGGPTKLLDAVYRELKGWNRWDVVTDRNKADLILVLTQRDSVEGFVSTGTATATGTTASGTAVGVPVKSSEWFLHVLDAHGGAKHWSSDTRMGGKLWRTWNSIAKSLVGDLQKRME